MAKLKALLDSLDGIPENQHEFYKEENGKFVLELDALDSHPGVAALKSALASVKMEKRKTADELNKLKEKIKDLPDEFDPAEYLTMKEKLAEYEADPDKNKEGKKNDAEAVAARKLLEQKIARMEKDHAKAVSDLQVKLDGKSKYISKLLIDEGLTKALVEAGVQPTFIKASRALLRDSVKVVEDGDGDYSAVVESDMGPMDVARYVTDWVASDEGKVFVTPAKGADAGGGGKGPPGKPGEANPWAKESWNMTEQGKMIRTDRGKAEKFAKQAGHKLSLAS